MSILASNRGQLDFDRKFSKGLFVAVNDNLKMFSEEEFESVKDFKKVLVAVYIRTSTDNLVLMIEEGKFADIMNVPDFISSGGIYPNILIDAGLVCGKTLVDKAFSFSNRIALEDFVANSICYPVGAVETSKKYILVYNVVLSGSLLVNPDIKLNQGFLFHPIETLNLADSLQKEISKSLITVKSEDTK